MLKRAGSSFSLRSGGSSNSSCGGGGSSSRSLGGGSMVGGGETTRTPTSRGIRDGLGKRQVSWNSRSFASSSFRGLRGSDATASAAPPPPLILLEGDADTPVIGSIECVRAGDDNRDEIDAASSSSSKSSSSSRLEAAPREVIRIICRPPPSDEDDAEDALDGSVINSNQDLVQFLVDSINELVDPPPNHHRSDPTNGGGRMDSIPEDGEEASAVGGVIEALSFACMMNPCVGGGGGVDSTGASADDDNNSAVTIPYRRTKSILRTRGVDNSRSPVEAGILSDRTVSFSRLEIHEFGMTLGDHPSAVSGPPIALDYDGTDAAGGGGSSSSPAGKSSSGRVVSVEEYERVRTPRRHRKQLKLSYHDKCATLRDKGFSLQELHDAWAEAILIRKQRHETLKQTYTSMMMDDFWESAGRKYHRVLESLALA